jgi:nitrate reductase gamma subunit
MTITYSLLLFAMFPYMALFLFFLGTIMRYRKAPFTYSSLSSQFLENQQHFWDMVSFHYGILLLFVGHLIGFLIPRQVLAWNGRPVRLYVLEVSALACGMLALVGLVGSMERRLVNHKARMVTSKADWMIEVLLLFQILLGIYVAVFHPWGSSWFAASLAPYLRSIFAFNPDVSYLTTLPLVIKLHIFCAWLIFALVPFTRLVHILVAPLPYLWRKPEVVRWYGQPLEPGFSIPTAVSKPGKMGAGA